MTRKELQVTAYGLVLFWLLVLILSGCGVWGPDPEPTVSNDLRVYSEGGDDSLWVSTRPLNNKDEEIKCPSQFAAFTKRESPVVPSPGAHKAKLYVFWSPDPSEEIGFRGGRQPLGFEYQMHLIVWTDDWEVQYRMPCVTPPPPPTF